jgi:hypothetical protein
VALLDHTRHVTGESAPADYHVSERRVSKTTALKIQIISAIERGDDIDLAGNGGNRAASMDYSTSALPRVPMWFLLCMGLFCKK